MEYPVNDTIGAILCVILIPLFIIVISYAIWVIIVYV